MHLVLNVSSDSGGEVGGGGDGMRRWEKRLGSQVSHVDQLDISVIHVCQ